MAKKTAKEKMLKPEVPEIVKDRRTGEPLLIPTPRQIDLIVREIPKGKVITTDLIRERLAKEAGASKTCPLCTGIFMNIIAAAAEEDRKFGVLEEKITPYWRVVKGDGSLNPKFPGGLEAHAAKLKDEGHTILPDKIGQPSKVQL